MAKILVHVAHGPENPTRATLAFLVAKAAVDEGHAVSLFLAGDAAQRIGESVIDSLTGLGTGRLREHFDALGVEQVVLRFGEGKTGRPGVGLFILIIQLHFEAVG